MQLYQPAAKGKNWMYENGTRYSKLVYRSRAEAEKRMDDFIKRVTTPIDEYDMGYLVEISSSYVVELGLVDGREIVE